jgi:DNA polymerase III delta prime subunit
MKIFLSAVSTEFEACRDALASDLRAVGAHVFVQREFTQQGRTLLEKLETYIAGCDRVIALVGNAYGWEPEAASLPPDAPRRSYTEWEYCFALGERLDVPRQPAKDTFVYFASPEFLGPTAPDQSADCAALQQAFIASFRATDKDHSTFGSVYELRALVLRDGFHLGGVTAQPDLVLELFNLTESTRFFYGAQRTPIVGRDEELRALDDFLHADARFAWWLMSGPAGVGKSRTALEVCLRAMRYRPAWRAGWLTDVDEFTEWRTWQPKAPTLIVVDNAARSVASVRKTIVVLFRRMETLAYPVRLLLLERDASEGWREQLTGSEADRHSLDASQYAKPLQLRGLDGRDLWAIVRAIVEREGSGASPDREQTVAALQKIDALQRPLFASFAADALAAGRDIGQWDRKELLESLLRTDMQRRWDPARVTEEEKNLLAVATLADGLPLTVLKSPPVEGWLPAPRAYSPDRYRVMCGRPSDLVLNPLTPAVLGEFFVLERLRASSSIDERPAALVNIALALPSGHRPQSISYGWRRGDESDTVVRLRQHLYFVARCARDFPDHPSLKEILGPLPGRNENSWGWAIDVANLIDELREHPGTLDFCNQLHDALFEVAFKRAQSRAEVPTYRICATGLNLALLSAQAGDTDALAHRYALLREVAAVEPKLARYQIGAGAVLAKVLALDHKLAAAHTVFSEIVGAWQALEDDDPAGPAYALVVSASTLVQQSAKAGDLDLARARYDDLRRALEKQASNGSLALYEARAIVSLAEAYIARAARADARALYEELRNATERYSRSAVEPTGAGPESPRGEAGPVESDPKPEITAKWDESGSSVAFEWKPSPRSNMGQMLGSLLEAAFIGPLLGHKRDASANTTTEAEPDAGPDLRHRMAALGVDLVRAYGEAEDIEHAEEICAHLRELAAGHPDEPAPTQLYSRGTYILWRVQLIRGHLTAAAAAADELRVLAAAHDEVPGYTRVFALAAYGTIDVWHDSGQPGAAELARVWGHILLRDEARKTIVAEHGADEAVRFYELIQSVQAQPGETPGAPAGEEAS